MKTKLFMIKLIMIPIIVVSFTSCGFEDAKFNGDETFTKISLENIICVTGTPTVDDLNGYETLYSGDQLIQNEDNTRVAIFHDEDDLKKVCLQSGSAYIKRFED